MSAEAAGIELVARAGGVELAVKVVPGASRSRVVGSWSNALKIAVTAPPEGGQANEAVAKLLAALFGVRKADVRIVAGQSRPLKRIMIAGLGVAAARQALSAGRQEC